MSMLGEVVTGPAVVMPVYLWESIGLWPCFAVIIMSVVLSRPCFCNSAVHCPIAASTNWISPSSKEGGAGSVQVTAAAYVGFDQFLPDADSLEVHTEDGRHLGLLRSVVTVAVNLVENAIHFQTDK